MEFHHSQRGVRWEFRGKDEPQWLKKTGLQELSPFTSAREVQDELPSHVHSSSTSFTFVMNLLLLDTVSRRVGIAARVCNSPGLILKPQGINPLYVEGRCFRNNSAFQGYRHQISSRITEISFPGTRWPPSWWIIAPIACSPYPPQGR